MGTFLASLASVYLIYSPVFLPCLLAYIVISNTSLRSYNGPLKYWIAVQKDRSLVLPETTRNAPDKPLSNPIRSYAVRVARMFFFTIFWVYYEGTTLATLFDAVYGLAIFPWAADAIDKILSALTGIHVLIVYRNAAGATSLRIQKRGRSFANPVLTLLFGVIAGVAIRNTAFTTIVLAGVLYTVESRSFDKVTTLQSILVNSIAYEITIIALATMYLNTVAIATVDIPVWSIGALGPFANGKAGWNFWISSLLWGVMPTGLISACLRLDYSNQASLSAKNGTFTRQSHAKYETIPVPSDPQLGPGVIMPSRLPAPFSKPYYTAALASWVLANGFLHGALASSVVTLHGYLQYSTLMTILATPVMCLAVLGVSIARGEMEMWNHEENRSLEQKATHSGSHEKDPLMTQGTEEGQPLTIVCDRSYK